jgi:putative PIN family toxin of toxin-antitoxin system
MKVDRPFQIVLDTNVLVAAFRSQYGTSYRLVSIVGDPRFELNLSVALAFEYEAVLKRKEHSLFLTAEDVDKLVNFLCSISNLREIHFLWRPALPDPDDDFLLELAIESNADYIVTFNSKDFLLSSGHGIPAIKPLEFLQIIGEST